MPFRVRQTDKEELEVFALLHGTNSQGGQAHNSSYQKVLRF